MVAAYVANALLILVLPFVAGAVLVRRLGRPWPLFFAGGTVFVLSQVVHIPVNLAVFRFGPPLPDAWRPWLLPLLLGLSAGLHEEGARWLALRSWSRDLRDGRSGLLWGAGHGGIEAVIVGLIALLAAFNVAVLMDPLALERLGPSKVAPLLAALWDQAWYMPFLGLVERVFVVPCHVAWAMLVTASVVRGTPWGWLTALLWHAGLDAGAVAAAAAEWHPLAVEGFVGVNGVAAIGVAWRLLDLGASPPAPHGPVVPARLERVPIERVASRVDP